MTSDCDDHGDTIRYRCSHYQQGRKDGYAAALRDAVEAVEDRIQDLSTCNKDDDCHMLARGAALALSDIESLGGDR